VNTTCRALGNWLTWKTAIGLFRDCRPAAKRRLVICGESIALTVTPVPSNAFNEWCSGFSLGSSQIFYGHLLEGEPATAE